MTPIFIPVPRSPRFRLLSLLLAALCAPLGAAVPPWENPPGWTETRGGAGGKTIRVTTLAANGPGSLAQALATPGPRLVEFAVAGTIDLGWTGLKVEQPYLTIAGETAPSPGITIVHGGMSIVTHDVIVRHLRIRPTDGPRASPEDKHVDALSTGGGAHDVIVDHCSFAWGSDENLSASGPRFDGATPDEWRKNTSHRVTFSHCIVGEGVSAANSKGTLVHDNATDIAIFGNFYISLNDRHPLFKGGTRAAMVNNFIHNPGQRVMQFGHVPSQWTGRAIQRAALTMAGNVVHKGPGTAAEIAFFEIWPDYAPCDFYLHDNVLLDATGRSLPAVASVRDRQQPRAAPGGAPSGASGGEYRLVPFQPNAEMQQVATPPVWPPRLKARPAGETAAWVLANAGARPWDRDALDLKLIADAKSGRGKLLHLGPPTDGAAVRRPRP